MTPLQGLIYFLANRSLWASVGVMLVVLLTWIGYPSKQTVASESDAQSAMATAQVPAPEQTLAETYSSWLSAAHTRVSKGGQDGSLPDQF